MRLFVALLFICTQIAVGERALQNIDISQRPRNEAETSIAISHSNPMLLKWITATTPGSPFSMAR